MSTPSPRPPRISREEHLARVHSWPAVAVVPEPRAETTPEKEVQP